VLFRPILSPQKAVEGRILPLYIYTAGSQILRLYIFSNEES
jgi:hypothetical protein